MEALDLKVPLDFKTLTLQQRIGELEEKLKLIPEGYGGVFKKGGGVALAALIPISRGSYAWHSLGQTIVRLLDDGSRPILNPKN